MGVVENGVNCGKPISIGLVGHGDELVTSRLQRQRMVDKMKLYRPKCIWCGNCIKLVNQLQLTSLDYLMLCPAHKTFTRDREHP